MTAYLSPKLSDTTVMGRWIITIPDGCRGLRIEINADRQNPADAQHIASRTLASSGYKVGGWEPYGPRSFKATTKEDQPWKPL